MLKNIIKYFQHAKALNTKLLNTKNLHKKTLTFKSFVFKNQVFNENTYDLQSFALYYQCCLKQIQLYQPSSVKMFQTKQFIDLKTIPKLQFELIDQELNNRIKQLFAQSKIQQKSINNIKKQIEQKLPTHNFIQSLKQMELNIQVPIELENLVPSSSKHKNYSDPSNPVLTQTFKVSNKLSIFAQVLSVFNSKMTNLEKRISQSQEKINQNVKEKVSSVQQQLLTFVKDYRANFKDLGDKFQQNKFNFENKVKQVQTNTVWKINECYKRLEDRPNVQMVKTSITQIEMKLSKMIQSGGKNTGSGYAETTKIQQGLIKLQKQMDINSVQVESQIKGLNEKLSTSYLNLKNFSDQKLQIFKKFQHLSTVNSDISRKIKSIQINNEQSQKSSNKLTAEVDTHKQQIVKIKQQVSKFTKNDQIAKLIQKIDPHQICRLSSVVAGLQQKTSFLDGRVVALGQFSQALRSRVQFWNTANGNGQNPEAYGNQKIGIELITKIIKDQISNSELKNKLLKLQQQIIDLSSVKEGVNDILKKLSRVNKDSDLASLKYELQGLQQFIKKQILLVTNRVNSIEISLNNDKKRGLSVRGKEDVKLQTSISTKKLISLNCLSCHQGNAGLGEKQRKTFYSSKFVSK